MRYSALPLWLQSWLLVGRVDGSLVAASRRMQQLPFDAQITEKLFHIVQDMSARDHRLTSDYVPSFVWAPQSFAVPGKASWVLAWLPSRDTQPERVFSVDGVSFYISPDVEPLLRGKVFDWDDKNGVVSHAA